MKLSKRILPFLLALPALMGFWACSNSSDELTTIEREEITSLKNQLRDELSNLNTDSLSSRTVWVAPEVTVVKDRSFDNQSWPFITGIIGIIFGCAVPVGIVAVITSSITTRRRYETRVVELAISRNYPLPAEFFHKRTVQQLLYRGIIWIGVGITCIAFAAATGNEDMTWLGVFPFFIGLANIALFILRRIDNRKKSEAEVSVAEAPEANPYSYPQPEIPYSDITPTENQPATTPDSTPGEDAQ